MREEVDPWDSGDRAFDDDEIEFAGYYRGLPPEDKETAKAVMRALLAKARAAAESEED